MPLHGVAPKYVVKRDCSKPIKSSNGHGFESLPHQKLDGRADDFKEMKKI